MENYRYVIRWLNVILVTIISWQALQLIDINYVHASENNVKSIKANENFKNNQNIRDLYYSYPYLKGDKYNLTPDDYKKTNSPNNSITIGEYKSVLLEKETNEINDINQDDNVDINNLSSLGGKIWHDINGNGVQEDNETLIEGVEVNLLDENKNVINTTKTDAFGRYEFDNLNQGIYYIKVNKPDEFNLSTQDKTNNDKNTDNNIDEEGCSSKIEIKDKIENYDIDFGMIKPINISGSAWNDINWDNKKEEDEHGISGMLVKLYKDGELFLKTKTDLNGRYYFNNLKPGKYKLEFVDLKNAYVPTTEDSANNLIDEDNFTKSYILISGDNKNDVNVAFHKAKIKSRIFKDDNFNGIQDADEKGIKNVTVNLYSEDGEFIKQTKTNDLGTYEFDNLLPDKYYIQVDNIKGCNRFSPKKSDTLLNASVVNKDGISNVFNIEKGQQYIYLNAGISFVGNIKVKVFEDVNYTGKYEEDDKLLKGTRVKLLSSSGDMAKDIYGNYVKDQISDEDGNVNFENLPKGEYKIDAIMPKGYSSFTKQSTNIKSNFSNVNTGGYSENINIETLDNYDEIKVGVIKSASIGNKVWYDDNKNGKQDKEEKGVEGIDVFLCDSNGKLLSVTKTDNDGKYNFTDLDPGKYYVMFETPKNLGTTNLKDNGLQTHKSRDINLSSGEADNSINLGVYVKPDLSKEVKKLPVTSKKGSNYVLVGGVLIVIGIVILIYKRIKCKKEKNSLQ